jgi:hypothetical protein
MPSSLRFKLVATFVMTLGTMISFAQCKEIDVEAKIVKKSSDINSTQSILVEIKESNPTSFHINLFGPKRNNILRSEKTEFNSLVSGKYLIVVVGKREEDNYCPKSINVTID